MCLWLEPPTGSSFILEVVSRYEDFTVPTLQVCIIFMGQCMLLGYYGVALLGVELDEISYLNWVVAFVAVQMGALFNRGKDSELGLPWSVKWWAIARHSATCHIVTSDGHIIKPRQWQLWMRHLFGFLANNLGWNLIAYTCPIFLMRRGPVLDFLMNSLALAFITKLDDTGESQITVTLCNGSYSSHENLLPVCACNSENELSESEP